MYVMNGGSGEDSSKDSTPRNSLSSHSILNDNNIINTVSPVLMQYRYDELVFTHRKCLKLLCKKEKLLKNIKNEMELLQSKYNRLLEDHKKAQKRMGILCCKFLNLQARKSDEIFQLNEALNLALKIIVNRCAWSRITDGDDEEKEFQKFVDSLKRLKLRICPLEWKK